jgi:hypothetical protein
MGGSIDSLVCCGTGSSRNYIYITIDNTETIGTSTAALKASYAETPIVVAAI